MSRRIEAGLGVLAGALALGGIALAVFAPAVFTYGTNTFDAGKVSLWDEGITTNVGIFLAVMICAATGLAAGAYLRSREMRREGVALLWVSAAALFVGALITLPGSSTAVVPSALHTDTADSVGIGIYLIVPACVALATAFMETATHTISRTPRAVKPR